LLVIYDGDGLHLDKPLGTHQSLDNDKRAGGRGFGVDELVTNLPDCRKLRWLDAVDEL
jgi:hypothetical protein